MNQLLRFCLCRSVLGRNPFSSEPISSSSSLISSNPTSSNLILTLVSKSHHTLNYPPQIFSTHGNQSRKFSGEPVGEDPAAAAERNSDDDDEISEEDDLKYEIYELHEDIGGARDDIELCSLPPLEAVKIPVDNLKALLKKFGLDNVKYRDYPPHLQSFRKEIALAKECVQEIVDFGRYAALGKYRGGRPNWKYFTKWYDAGGMEELESFEFKNECDTSPTAHDQIPMPVDGASSSSVETGAVGGDPAAADSSVDNDDMENEISNKDDLKDETSNEDDLKHEIFELLWDVEEALDNIELRTRPPLDAVKILADQLEALLRKWGLDNVKCGDYPPHLQSFEKEIEFWKVRVRETVDFGKYAAAGKYSGRRPYWVDFKKWYDAGGMVELESSESKNECDALPTAQDRIPMPVDGASSVADRH